MRLYDYAASGNCLKVRLLLRLLDVECERVPTDIFGGDTLTEEYGRRNPVRETPVLELDDGTAIAQSPAILWYLAEGTSWLPDDRLGRALVAQWLAFEQEWTMRGVAGARFRLITGRPGGEERVPMARRAMELLDDALSSRDWLVGARPSIADLANYAYASRSDEARVPLAEHPHVAAWIARLRALPGFVDDLAPYPRNAQAGASRSIYD